MRRYTPDTDQGQDDEAAERKAAQDRQTREILVAARVQKILDDAGFQWDDVRALQLNDLAYRVNVYRGQTTRAEMMGLARLTIVRSYYVIVDRNEMIRRSLPEMPKVDPAIMAKQRPLTDHELASDAVHSRRTQGG